MRLELVHTTSYQYSDSVAGGLNQLRLVPRTLPGQQVVEWDVTLSGATRELSYNDQFDNRVDLVSLTPGSEFTIHVQGVVDTLDYAGVRGKVLTSMPLPVYRRTTALTTPGPLVEALARDVEERAGESTLTMLHELSGAVADAVVYEEGHTDVTTTAERALQIGKGVCQDHAHVFLAAARQLGFPARYVSGYLMLVDSIEQAASHAWAEAYVDELGWVGFDVSNRISPDARYVLLAAGLDYSDAAPISGIRLGGGSESMDVSLSVQQLPDVAPNSPDAGDVAQPVEQQQQ